MAGSGHTYELIAVDDGSSDGTGEAARPVDLAALAFQGHAAEHVPHVAVAQVDVLPVSRPPEPLNDAPVHQVAQVHACVAATDVQAVDDLVHAMGPAGDQEQRVNLRHRAVDAPGGAHPAPFEDELILNLAETIQLFTRRVRHHGAF